MQQVGGRGSDTTATAREATFSEEGGALGPGTWDDPSLLALVAPTMWLGRRFPSPLIGATMRGAISALLEAISVGDL